jgi:maltooligosyltrehalose trehalohydrolase
MQYSVRFPIGACFGEARTCVFRVWAPHARSVQARISSPMQRVMNLRRDTRGYHAGEIADVEPGSLYVYRLDDQHERPDPASRFQPQGVHGPSAIVDPSFAWDDSTWKGLSLEDYVCYELHVGTFTRQGTFQAVIPHLDRLADLGVTAVELMPVAQFPGTRNWGYDGTYPFAVQNSYGGPTGLKNLINACHQRGLAVILDVVYNHLGPEGNYLADFGPYFTDTYKTPWGSAINFDGPHSDEVRRFFIENALYWVTEFHVDALRIDAVHGIFDFSAHHFLEELTSEVHCRAEELKRRIYVIAESDLNDSRLIKPKVLGGYGLDAQWNEDFHHALHTLLTKERSGYYADFGHTSQLAKALKDGFVFSGEYSVYRNRRHGNSSAGLPPQRFIVFSQNHDQVGNRLRSDRLSHAASLETLKLAAGAVLLSPQIPLLFMGEEYGEKAPFPYFVCHSDPSLIEAVRQGRKAEFAAFQWMGEPADPQDEATFALAKLNRELREETHHALLYKFYRELLRLRKRIRLATQYGTQGGEVIDREDERLLLVSVSSSRHSFMHLFHFGHADRVVKVPMAAGAWEKLLESSDTRWGGPGSALPTHMVSEGCPELRLQAQSVLVFVMG